MKIKSLQRDRGIINNSKRIIELNNDFNNNRYKDDKNDFFSVEKELKSAKFLNYYIKENLVDISKIIN